MEMCCAHHGGRLFQFSLQLERLAACKASTLAMRASKNYSCLGHILMSVFFSFISGFWLPETEWSHTAFTKPLALEASQNMILTRVWWGGYDYSHFTEKVPKFDIKSVLFPTGLLNLTSNLCHLCCLLHSLENGLKLFWERKRERNLTVSIQLGACGGPHYQTRAASPVIFIYADSLPPPPLLLATG